ncbi:hypothetical protein B0J13DRAFT_662115 [Dactylonectria estremocensis]|uniref:Uncharacterized protein n=1 Tax=Dactylonectria estremocensis TaxID=1079267 RepID=A0A9P9D0D7_9HYPO|nr:hypothetical protein B0J13DRAFT_662115 [Dactylonectria estremocensis]
MTLRHCDSWQLVYNVFVLDSQVMIVSDRDKMKVICDNSRKVARFLPDRIGRMVVAYIAWLIPAERMLRREGKLAEQRGDQLEFMWRNGNSRMWGTDQFSAVMGRFMPAGTGVWLGVGRYWPVVIEMGRKIRGLAMNQAEAHMQQDDGDEHDDIEVDLMTGEPMDCGGSWNIMWDLQATHGTRVALQHYAVHVGLLMRLQPEIIKTFQEISRLWHQFLEDDGDDGGKDQGDSSGGGSASAMKVAGTKRKAGPAADNDNESKA